MWTGLCGFVYVFIHQFGIFVFFVGLYLCWDANAYGLLMKIITPTEKKNETNIFKKNKNHKNLW